ncbi:hypothetical protein, partial [Escherichia coli]
KGYSTKIGYDNKETIRSSIEISRNEGTNNYSQDYGASNTAKREFENQLINTKLEYKLAPELILNARYSNFRDEQNYVENAPYIA